MEYTDRWIHEQIENCATCQDRKASVEVGAAYPCDKHFEILYSRDRASMLGFEEKPVKSFAEFLATALGGATCGGAIGVHVRNSLVLLTEERKTFDNTVYCHKLASWHVDPKMDIEAAELRIHKGEERREAERLAKAESDAELDRLEWEKAGWYADVEEVSDDSKS